VTPGLRAERGGPEEGSRGWVPPSSRRSELQLLTHTCCRDLLGFRAKLGHEDLNRSKDAPVGDTHITRASRGYFFPLSLHSGVLL